MLVNVVEESKQADCKIANIRDGRGDQKSCFWNHGFDIFRATLSTGEEILHIGSPHEWAHWVEHSHLLEESRIQSDRDRYANRA